MMSDETVAPALMPPPIIKWSIVKSDAFDEVVVGSGSFVFEGVDVVVLVVCPADFTSEDPFVVPVEFVFVLVLVELGCVVEELVVGFLVTVSCAIAKAEESKIIIKKDNTFFICQKSRLLSFYCISTGALKCTEPICTFSSTSTLFNVIKSNILDVASKNYPHYKTCTKRKKQVKIVSVTSVIRMQNSMCFVCFSPRLMVIVACVISLEP